jgi:hypothetical protein
LGLHIVFQMGSFGTINSEDRKMRETQCMLCKHSTFIKGRGSFCAAFPEGIPQEVSSGRIDHRRPIAGDHGVQYEPSARAIEFGIALKPLEITPSFEGR